MRIFKWQMFKTKEEAKAFQKKHGGVYHNLDWEQQRGLHDSITFYEVSEKMRKDFPFSIEWTEFM